jgi:2-keto-4-pentenoate hydratase/2-oxohepta-3-ene-1,7-dioic acid hydratase in catechol pathway
LNTNYKIIRFQWEQDIRYGIIDEDAVFTIEGSIFDKFKPTRKLCNLSDVKLLPPVRPGIVAGVGGNYLSVVKQGGNTVAKEPQLFIRPASTVIGHLDNIVYPKTSHLVNYGAEMAVVMKHKAWDIPENKIADYILGYTCGVDLTAFDLLKEDGFKQMRGKSFPTSQPLGPCIATGLNGDNIHIQSRLNNKVIEDGSTADMVFNVRQIVSYTSRYMILEPGDVILTGQMRTTEIKVGDTLEIEMEGIGTLKNEVVSV